MYLGEISGQRRNLMCPSRDISKVMLSWWRKRSEPADNCEQLMEKYLKCVNGMKKGLSEIEGECEEQKERYRSCVRKSREEKKDAER
ncbi:hypothetical protein AAMO2058_000695100 [Amorphochlora amoebiformis]